MNNYSYQIFNNGYKIYLNDRLLYSQFEPCIPNPNLSYEQNAIQQIQQLKEEHITNFLTLEERIKRLEQLMDYFIQDTSPEIKLPNIKLKEINEII